MLTYEKIVRKPKHFQSFAGITPQQFDFLSQKIQSITSATEKKRLSSIKRERKVGAWHPFKLSVTTRILSDSQAKIRTLNINRESSYFQTLQENYLKTSLLKSTGHTFRLSAYSNK